MTTTHYELGNRVNFTKNTGPLVVINRGVIGGIEIYARDEQAGEYVHVLENAPDIWVDDEVQSYTVGNFGDVESARKFGSMAYRYLNKRRGL